MKHVHITVVHADVARWSLFRSIAELGFWVVLFGIAIWL